MIYFQLSVAKLDILAKKVNRKQSYVLSFMVFILFIFKSIVPASKPVLHNLILSLLVLFIIIVLFLFVNT